MTKKSRRTKKEMEALRDGLFSIVEELKPVTVRHVFYQAVSRGLIEKTEKEYCNVVKRLLGAMRMGGRIPFGWISDNSRWMRKPNSYSKIEQLLRDASKTYRK